MPNEQAPDQPSEQERSTLIAEIATLLGEVRHPIDPDERLDGRSRAYLVARRDSLAELAETKRQRRADAHATGDVATVLRLDGRPTEDELAAAHNQVAASGVADAQRADVAARLAYRFGWDRAARGFIARSVQQRLDAGIEPTDDEIRRVQGNTLASASVAEVHAAAQAIARRRVVTEAEAAARAALPLPPPMPRVPPAH